MNDVYLGEDHYKNIAITEINEAINFCMINKLSKDKIKKIAKIDYSQIVKDSPRMSLGFFLTVVTINICFLFVPMLLGY